VRTYYYDKQYNYVEMTEAEKVRAKRIDDILKRFTQEMEGYSYFGSNPGISEDDYEYVADAIMGALGLWERREM
jgi:hypothetical protein